MQNNKPYSQMTPAERTALRIAQNKKIDTKAATVKAARTAYTNARVSALFGAAKQLMQQIDSLTPEQIEKAKEARKARDLYNLSQF